jgi:cytochrome c biogenesis protein CcmG, thiol:disulfide interchange protein DsbE
MDGRLARWRRLAAPLLLAIFLLTAVAVGTWVAVSGSGTSGGTSTAQTPAALKARSESGALPANGGPAVGSSPPSLSLPSIEAGQPPVSLTEFRGRPIVVDFFASWCVPCKAELPRLARAWERLGSRVAFVGVDVNDSTAHALALLRADHVGYPVGTDPDDVAALRFHLVGLPTAVFIGADGRVVYSQTGQLSEGSLNHWLRRLVASSA